MKEMKESVRLDFGGSSCHYIIESFYANGKRLDTLVDLSAVKFVIAGEQLEQFKKELEELVNKYFI